MNHDRIARFILFLSVLGGALLGGRTAKLLARDLPSAADLVRCFAGGLLMGLGGALIPGSDDGLILMGLPLLQPHAWAALVAMFVAIIVALTFARAR